MSAIPRAAIVTGAGTGIGRAVALRLARDGFGVAILDIDLERVRETAKAIEVAGGVALPIACDVSDEREVNRAISTALNAIPGVDVLVNGVGVTSPPGLPFTNNTEQDWDRVFAVNVKSMFFTSKAVVSAMIGRGGGRIVNIGSIAGLIAARPMPPYSVTKMASITLTKVLARDLAEHGITVNAVCPGFVWTDLWSDGLAAQFAQSDEVHRGSNAREIFEQRVRDLVPMRRSQSVDEIAAAVAFLVSDDAANITGQSLNVDGGVTI